MTANQLQVCVVGAGPRGLSVLERICANAGPRTDGRRITVHLVDPHRPGSGNVWRTDQSRHLLMNTVAGQVTLFTDDSVSAKGVIAPGPSLYEWARGLALTGAFGEYDDQVMAEVRDLTPDSYPTRALYGQYLEWVLRRVLSTAPDVVSVHVHPMRAVRLDDEPDGRQCLALANGTRLSGLDAVVLAQGHLPSRPDAGEREFTEFAERHGLTYLPPGNPADLDLSALLPGQPVLLRGLGLNFFDHLTMLTSGRGGLFERRDGRLVYHPSGQEPRLYAGSRRGVPHVSRGRNQKGAHGRHLPQVLVPDVLDRLRAGAAHGGLDFRAELWPLIAKEVEAVYYTALLARRGCTRTAEAFSARYLPLPWGSPEEAELLAEFAVPPATHWDWEAVARPDVGRTFRSPADFRDWLLGLLRDDCAQAAEGNVDGPVKAALDAMRDLRNEIRLLVDHGGLTGRSHRDDLDGWYTPLNTFLSIGPPAGRIEEMTALIEAGVLDVLGPGTRIVCDRESGGFRAESAVPGTLVRAAALIEARLPEPDLRRTADPLLGHLLATGQCRPFSITDDELGRYETGGLDVAERPYRLLDAAGAAHRRRFAFGVPTEGVHWVTAAGARPGVDSVTLTDSDAISLAVLAIDATDHGAAETRAKETGSRLDAVPH